MTAIYKVAGLALILTLAGACSNDDQNSASDAGGDAASGVDATGPDGQATDHALPDALAPATCKAGSRDGPKGSTNGLSTVGSVAFNLRTPSGYDPTKGHPLIVVYAAAGGTKDNMETFTKLTAPATAAGHIIAYVNHVSPVNVSGVTDIAGIPAQIAKRWCVDEQRIYLTGHSDGGSVIYVMADLALTVASRTPEHPACLDALGQSLFVLMADGDLSAAVARGTERLPLLEQHAQRPATLMALQTVVEAHTFQGDFLRAAQMLDSLRRTAHHLQDRHILLQADGQQAFLEVYQDPGPDTMALWDDVIERSKQAKDRFVRMWFSVFRPHALLRARGQSHALEAVPAAEEFLRGEAAYLHTSLASGYIGLILADELWRRGGADRELTAGIRRHLKMVSRKTSRVRLLQPMAYMLEAELAMAAGDAGKGETLLQKARKTEHARQSPLLAFQIDTRGALWAMRRGEAGACQKLEAMAALARDDGWGGEARHLERYLEE